MQINTVPDLPQDLDPLYEALQKAEERATAGRLALEVMHEIRNPLEALANLTYLTAHSADDGDRVREYMCLAEEQMATISRIANQTLGFARSSHFPQKTNLVGVAEAALRIHQSVLQEKRVHLVKQFPKELIAEVHTGEILQAISNVIVNALDALPEKGSLCLRLRKFGDEAQILIADSGHGIPKEHVMHIFRPFYTTKEQKGNGLGLAISKNIVERHNGKVRVRSSVNPGKSGTTFRISLPA